MKGKPIKMTTINFIGGLADLSIKYHDGCASISEFVAIRLDKHTTVTLDRTEAIKLAEAILRVVPQG